MKDISLSVVIMAYNEADTIEKVVRDTESFLEKRTRQYEIIIVNDGSTDQTPEKAEELSRSNKSIRVIHHKENKGMGMAIRTGYINASMEYVTQLPGDGQIDPEMIGRLLPYLCNHDLVLSFYGYRDDGKMRQFLTKCYQIVAKIILDDPCTFTGTMVFKRELLDLVRLTSKSFMINVELPLKLINLGVIPAYVEIECKRRAYGKSKVISFSKILQVIQEMIKIRREILRPNS